MNYKIALIMASAMIILSACSKQETEVSDTAETETTLSVAAEVSETTAAESEPAEAAAETTATEGEFIDYIMGDVNIFESDAENVFEQLISNGVIGEEVYMLGWSAEAVSDGIHSTKDGLVEMYHIEGTLDISLPFTDILNQKAEQEQIDTLTAIAKAYKDVLNVDIVRITCNGESVITDNISYDEMVAEKIEKLVQDVEDVEADEAYEEE